MALLRQSIRKLWYGYAGAFCLYDSCEALHQPHSEGRSRMVGEEGVEPSRPYGQQILSLSCMPFHHLPANVIFQILRVRGLTCRLATLEHKNILSSEILASFLRASTLWCH